MKIIRKGNLNTVYQGTCHNCGCTVQVEENEIKYNSMYENSKINPYVDCLECASWISIYKTYPKE